MRLRVLEIEADAAPVIYNAANQAAMLELTPRKGDYCKRNDSESGLKYIYVLNQLPASTLGNWAKFAIWFTEGSTSLPSGVMVECGNFASSSGNLFPITGGTGASGAILKGNTFTNTGDQYVGRARLVAKIDSPGTNPDNWEVQQAYIGYTPMNLSLRVNTLNSPNNADVPSTAAVDNAINARLDGLKWKEKPCRIATIGLGNITLSGLQTIDGIALIEENRVLVGDNTDKRQNGPYIAREGAWVRSSDGNTGTELENATFTITEGTANGGKVFTQITKNVVLETSEIIFADRGNSATFSGLLGSPSDNTALAAALAAKANDSEVAKLSGNQTVGGVKDFADGFCGKYVKGPDISGNVTLDATYANKLIYVTAAAVITVPNSIFSANQQIRFIREGAGEVSFVEGSDHTINSSGTPKRLRIAERYAPVELIFRSPSISTLIGGTKV